MCVVCIRARVVHLFGNVTSGTEHVSLLCQSITFIRLMWNVTAIAKRCCSAIILY